MLAYRRTHLLRIAGPVAVALLACALSPQTAFAQESCNPDSGVAPYNYGEIATMFPNADSTGVPIDGFIRVRYVGHAPLRPFVIVQDPAGTAVTGTTNVVDDELLWQADTNLLRTTRYRVQIPDSTGVNAVRFTTGSMHSTEAPPTFSGLQDVTFQKAGAADRCGDPNAVEVTLFWQRAGSTGWPDSEIEYVIFETRGPGISGPIERGRERLQPGGSNTCTSRFEFCPTIRLSSANSAAPVCFNVQAVDPYGRMDGNSRETCIDPSRGNFFVGCTVRPDAPRDAARTLPRGALALALGGVSLASLAVARRRRQRRAAATR